MGRHGFGLLVSGLRVYGLKMFRGVGSEGIRDFGLEDFGLGGLGFRDSGFGVKSLGLVLGLGFVGFGGFKDQRLGFRIRGLALQQMAAERRRRRHGSSLAKGPYALKKPYRQIKS